MQFMVERLMIVALLLSASLDGEAGVSLLKSTRLQCLLAPARCSRRMQTQAAQAAHVPFLHRRCSR